MAGESEIHVQEHHFLTDKHSEYTERFEEILRRFGLDTQGDWNKEFLPQRGRHAPEYHEWAYNQVKQIASEAKTREEFLELFEDRVKAPVRKNPDMLTRDYWDRDQ